MMPFNYHNAGSLENACRLIDHKNTQAIAGGTTQVDLMKLNVLTPKKLVHIRTVLPSSIRQRNNVLSIGAGATMAELADAPAAGKAFPVIRQSLILAATPQIRNMATIGGNLLQRTRSPYYRHPDMPVDGHPIEKFGEHVDTSLLAVLGNGGQLVGMYPGDFGVSTVAFDAELELTNAKTSRRIKARDFYQQPKDAFQYSTALKSGEMITALHFPVSTMLKNSIYLKIRERSSYAFALASVALGLDIVDGIVRQAHVGIGGLGSIPWHSPEAERELIGQPATRHTFLRAAEAALAPAQPPYGLEYKVTLAKNVLVRGLTILRDHGPLNDNQLWAMQHGRGSAQSSS